MANINFNRMMMQAAYNIIAYNIGLSILNSGSVKSDKDDNENIIDVEGEEISNVNEEKGRITCTPSEGNN